MEEETAYYLNLTHITVNCDICSLKGQIEQDLSLIYQVY